MAQNKVARNIRQSYITFCIHVETSEIEYFYRFGWCTSNSLDWAVP
jgi:hypothetical protein